MQVTGLFKFLFRLFSCPSCVCVCVKHRAVRAGPRRRSGQRKSGGHPVPPYLPPSPPSPPSPPHHHPHTQHPQKRVHSARADIVVYRHGSTVFHRQQRTDRTHPPNQWSFQTNPHIRNTSLANSFLYHDTMVSDTRQLFMTRLLFPPHCHGP